MGIRNRIYRLDALEKAGLTNLKALPFSIRVVLEAALRQCNDKEITQRAKNIAAGRRKACAPVSRFYLHVVMQDFTGVPAVVDLAAMRSAVARLGGDPKKINPLVPVDLVIDHSVQVDFFACRRSVAIPKWNSSATGNAMNSSNGDKKPSATFASSRR